MKPRAYHYRSDGNQSVIHATRVLDTAALEGQLQTAAAHSKAHRVHVNVVIESGTMPRL